MAKTLAEKAAYQRAYRQARKQQGRPLQERTPEQVFNQGLWKKFKLRPETYHAMWQDQGGACAICRRPFAVENQPGMHADNCVVDHCHRTGKVRGLLCPHCNLGLGHFFDSPALLEAAQHYLP